MAAVQTSAASYMHLPSIYHQTDVFEYFGLTCKKRCQLFLENSGFFFLSPSFKVFYEMFLYQGSQMVKVRSIKLMLARPVLIRRCLMLFQTLTVETFHQPKSQLCASTLEMNGTTLTMRTCCMPAKPHWPWVQLMQSSSILKKRKYLVEKPRLILFIR